MCLLSFMLIIVVMKKISALLICLQLILFPLHSGMAQSNTQASTPPNEETSKQYGQQTPDAGKNAKYDSESQSQGGYDVYAKQVLAISTSIIGANIIEQCSFGLKIPSIVTFMAGSLVHILSEFAGAKQQNEDHNKRIENIKKVEAELKSQGGEVQKELLTQRYKEEVSNKEYLESRQKWMMAVTAIYWTAMGLALMEESSGLAAAVSSGTTTCASVADKLSKPCGKAYAACYAAHFPACLGAMPMGQMTTYGNFANSAAYTISQSSCSSAAVYAQGCLAYTNAYHGIAWANCQPLSAGGGIKGMLMAKAIKMAYSAGLTRTSGSPVASYVVMLHGLLQLMVPGLQKLTLASYNYPIPRSVTFAVSAGLATMITTGLGQRIEVAKKNISDMGRVLAQFRTETDDDTVLETDLPREEKDEPVKEDLMIGSGKLAGSSQKSNAVNQKSKTSLTENKQTAETKSCLSQEGDQVEYSAKACANPIKLEPAKLAEGKNTVLEEASRLSTNLAQAFAEGNTEKASIIAADLSSRLTNIKAATQKLQEEQKERMKKEGIELEDFNQSTSRHVASLVGELTNAAKEAKVNINSSEQKAFRNESFLAANVPVEANSVKKDSVPLIASNGVAVAPSVAEKANYKMSDLIPFDDASSSQNPESFKLSDEALKAARSNGYLEIEEQLKKNPPKEDGIFTGRDSSLFKQVSNRYFQYYPRLKNRSK